MRARNMMLLAFVAVFSAATQGTEPEAWWDICDGCTSDSDFSSRALQIPAPYERVYISNTLTNETRRFQRTIILDDLWGGASQTIFANEQPLDAHEAQAFYEIIENAGTVFLGIARDTLDAFSGLSGRDSVVGDLSNGRLSAGLISRLQAYLLTEGYQGSVSDVEAEFGFDFVVSYNATVNLDDVRGQPLTVRITYPNGSSLLIKLDEDLDEILSVSAVDDEGNEIAFDLNDSNLPVAPALGVDYSFETATQSWVSGFRANLDALDGYSCSSWAVAGNYIIVRCQRP